MGWCVHRAPQWALWHVSLGNTFEYSGEWTVDTDWTHGKSYTFALGILWVPVSSMWHNDATGYGQLLLDEAAVKEQELAAAAEAATG